jgi:DNA-binding NarL/FixJ family response regulator
MTAKGGARILIVDDHPAMRHAVAMLISKEPDLEVFAEAGSREEAIDALIGAKPDMAVVDVSLQEGKASGIDLIRDILSIAGHIPVLVVSMYDQKIYIDRAFEAGASGYLTKQAPVEKIITAIRTVLKGKNYFPDNYVPAGKISAAEIPETLTPREFEVFRLLGQGMPAREIAEALHLTVKTVETHKLNIKKKLDYSSMSEMVRFAVTWLREHA